MNIWKRGNGKSGKTKTIINLVFRSTAENFKNYMDPAKETKHNCYGNMNIKFFGQTVSLHDSDLSVFSLEPADCILYLYLKRYFVFNSFSQLTYTLSFSYKNIFRKNIEAEICEILGKSYE